jgi:hypothetical protein
MDGRFVKDRDLNALEINAEVGGIGMMNWSYSRNGSQI